MQIDIYTKVVLTVIAASLVGLLLKDVPLVTTADAQAVPDVQPMAVNIVQIDGKPFVDREVEGEMPALPVRMK